MKVERAHRLCGAEAVEDGERSAPGLQRGGVEPGPGPAAWGGNVEAEVEAGGAEQARVVGRELALQARPRRVGVGSRVELLPHQVAEEVRHHLEDDLQLCPQQLQHRRVPSGDCG
jgi:hypothetical protein